jgi:hypothetical protein
MLGVVSFNSLCAASSSLEPLAHPNALKFDSCGQPVERNMLPCIASPLVEVGRVQGRRQL